MTPPEPEMDPSSLQGRLAALAGIDRVRAAAGSEPVYVVGGAVRDLLLFTDGRIEESTASGAALCLTVG